MATTKANAHFVAEEHMRAAKLAFHCFWLTVSVIIAVATVALHLDPTLAVTCPAIANVLMEVTDFVGNVH